MAKMLLNKLKEELSWDGSYLAARGEAAKDNYYASWYKRICENKNVDQFSECVLIGMKVGGAYVARLCKPFESNYRKYVSTFVLVKYLSEWSEEMSRSVKKTQRKIVNLGITYLLLIRSGINQKHLRSTFPTISIPPLKKIIPRRNAETFSI